jgi:hypothetical protein
MKSLVVARSTIPASEPRPWITSAPQPVEFTTGTSMIGTRISRTLTFAYQAMLLPGLPILKTVCPQSAWRSIIGLCRDEGAYEVEEPHEPA